MTRRKGPGRVLIWLLVLKVGYLLAVYLAVRSRPALDRGVFDGVNQHWPRQGGPVFATHFATWDAAHYLYLSEVGYSAGVASCAFYPLWPLSIRAFALCTGGNHLVSGLILANLFSLAGSWLFYLLVERRFGARAAAVALMLLLLFPGSLFFQFIYSESLFFLLLMLLWLGLELNRPSLVLCCAFLLPLTRAIGVFCLLPIAWHFLRGPCARLYTQWWKRDRTSQSFDREAAVAGLYLFARECLGAAPFLLAPLLGWGAYFFLMGAWTGNPFEGMEAQRFWGVQSIHNIVDLPKFIMAYFSPTAFHEFTGSLLDRIIFGCVVLTVPLVWRLGKDLFLWLMVLAFLPALSGDFVSFTRFCAVAFPVFTALGVYFTARPGKRLPLLCFGICGGLHLVLLWRFVNYHWAG
ncbi:MAG: mannosyltransferase family protein [Limisphaerales bacterium]